MPNLAGLRTLRALEHIDTDRRPRQAALMAFLALQDAPVPLTPRILEEELGRASGGVRYDRRLLEEMLDRRLVFRWKGAGRRPHLWAVNDRIDEWRGVRWITPRRAVDRLLRAPLCEPLGSLCERIAGQRGCLCEPQPRSEGGSVSLTSTNEVHTTTQEVHTTTQPPGLLPPECSHYDPATGAPSPCLGELSALSLSENQAREAGSSSDDRPDQLRQAVNRALEYVIWPNSDPGRRLAALEAAHPDRMPELLRAAARNKAGGSILGAVEDLELLAAAPARADTRTPWAAEPPLEAADPELAAAHVHAARASLGRRTPKVG